MAFLFDRTRVGLVVEMRTSFMPQVMTITTDNETSTFSPSSREALTASFHASVEQAQRNGWTLGWIGRGPTLN